MGKITKLASAVGLSAALLANSGCETTNSSRYSNHGTVSKATSHTQLKVKALINQAEKETLSDIEPLELGVDYNLDTSELNITTNERLKIENFISKELSIYPKEFLTQPLTIQVVNKIGMNHTNQTPIKGLTPIGYTDGNMNGLNKIYIEYQYLAPELVHHEFGHYLDLSKMGSGFVEHGSLYNAGEKYNDLDFISKQSKGNELEEIAVLHQKLFTDADQFAQDIRNKPGQINKVELYTGAEVDKEFLKKTGKLHFTRMYSDEELKKRYNLKHIIFLKKFSNDVPNYIDYLNNIVK